MPLDFLGGHNNEFSPLTMPSEPGFLEFCGLLGGELVQAQMLLPAPQITDNIHVLCVLVAGTHPWTVAPTLLPQCGHQSHNGRLAPWLMFNREHQDRDWQKAHFTASFPYDLRPHPCSDRTTRSQLGWPTRVLAPGSHLIQTHSNPSNKADKGYCSS